MKDKKMVAAIAAVMAHIRTEEEMAAVQLAEPARPVGLPGVFSESLNLWGLSGRQAIMNMRSMMQMKSFHGSKIR